MKKIYKEEIGTVKKDQTEVENKIFQVKIHWIGFKSRRDDGEVVHEVEGKSIKMIYF